MDNRAYYDDFAAWYERERGHGYHRMLDDLEVELVERHAGAGEILEVGCGTGLILGRVAGPGRRAVGLDLSRGMLAGARERGLDVVQSTATALPFDDERFDCTYSFKVLPHVEDISAAMAEMARVTRPGGTVLAEFYNTRSLRYLVKVLKPPTAVSESTSDEAVYTRYDNVDSIQSYLPPTLEVSGWRGVRIVTPVAQVHKLPAIGGALRWIEHKLADAPLARQLGGFLIAVLRRN